MAQDHDLPAKKAKMCSFTGYLDVFMIWRRIWGIAIGEQRQLIGGGCQITVDHVHFVADNFRM